MAMRNRKCFCCGTQYSYCPDCSRSDALKESWNSEFCSEKCKTLWQTLTRFGMGMISKAEAKEVIAALELKPIESYVACVQRDYAKVMIEEKKSKKSYRKFEPVEHIEIEEQVVVVPVIDDNESHEVVFIEE